jgi:hypothetical protein
MQKRESRTSVLFHGLPASDFVEALDLLDSFIVEKYDIL